MCVAISTCRETFIAAAIARGRRFTPRGDHAPVPFGSVRDGTPRIRFGVSRLGFRVPARVLPRGGFPIQVGSRSSILHTGCPA